MDLFLELDRVDGHGEIAGGRGIPVREEIHLRALPCLLRKKMNMKTFISSLKSICLGSFPAKNKLPLCLTTTPFCGREATAGHATARGPSSGGSPLACSALPASEGLALNTHDKTYGQT